MTITRNNHYVPQWYQKGFTVERANELCHLSNKEVMLPNGNVRKLSSKKWYTSAQCFYQKDLSALFCVLKLAMKLSKSYLEILMVLVCWQLKHI